MQIELNVDAMVGPSHHFGGLGVGNVASQAHAAQRSHPREAALEGLRKAELVSSLGVPQAIWLPPARPRFDFLGGLGFGGSKQDQLIAAFEDAPRALSAAYSSAFMWAANSATVTPACDTTDGKCHFTPANLISSWHRASEADERSSDIAATFRSLNPSIHAPLSDIVPLRDEGAANHMRLCDANGENGIHVFVHGAEDSVVAKTSFFPRHTRAASEAIARRHCIPKSRAFFLHQHPDAISAGVFHNDVIATSHQGILLHHEQAFLNGEDELANIEATFHELTGSQLQRIEISSQLLPLEDAVQSYLFNSQIVSTAREDSDGKRMALVCPAQCERVTTAKRAIESVLQDPTNPIEDVHYVSLAESMANGGGPACLRLRVTVEESKLQWMREEGAIMAEPNNLETLRTIVEDHYPAEVQFADLKDLQFAEQIQNTDRIFREAFPSM